MTDRRTPDLADLPTGPAPTPDEVDEVADIAGKDGDPPAEDVTLPSE